MDKIQYAQKNGIPIMAPVFEGKTIDKMPELVAQGCKNVSIAEIIDLRNNAFKSGNKEWIQQVCYNYFDSDSIVYHPDGRIKFVCDSPNLKNLTPKSKLENFAGWSALNLEKEEGAKRFDELPDEINGVQLVFDRKEIKEFTGEFLKEKQVPNNKFWLASARGDENRLGTYVENVYLRCNGNNFMKIRITDEKPNFEAERLLCISGLGDNSNIYGNLSGRLDDDYGRLIGLTIPTVTKMNLEALMSDFKTLSDKGDLTPKTQALYKALESGKYNL